LINDALSVICVSLLRLVGGLLNPAIAIAAVLHSQSHDGLHQAVFVSSHNDRVALRAAWLADDPAGVAFREPILLPNPLDRLPAPLGAYKFPERCPSTPASQATDRPPAA
jgi:hypothetical protein